MRTKEIDIPDYGKVILKKMNYLERCNFKGKIIKISIKQVNGISKEEQHIDTGALFFWTLVYSIKSLPKYPNFWELDESKKADIVSYIGDSDNEPDNLGEVLFKEARDLNPLNNSSELKKK